MTQGYDPYHLASPTVYLIKILIFLVLVALVAAILFNQLVTFFWANPFINGLILFVGCLVVGVAAGARHPQYVPESTPRSPDSMNVGTSGIAAERWAPVTAIARSLPTATCCLTELMPANIIVTCPPSTSATAGPVPARCRGGARPDPCPPTAARPARLPAGASTTPRPQEHAMPTQTHRFPAPQPIHLRVKARRGSVEILGFDGVPAAGENFRVVANMVRAPGEGDALFQKFQRVTSKFLDVCLEYVGEIPEDPYLRRSIREQRPVVSAFPACPASRAFKKLALKATTTRKLMTIAQVRMPRL